jgi:magnesium-transporting ATPase (P-type)
MNSENKKNLVTFLNFKVNVVTMAIGDGYNDAEMLNEARIGVCIRGNEYTFSKQVCDFYLPEFKDVWRLLFVHGRWAYIRICDLILILFYSNVMFTMPQVVYCFYNGYSMTSIYFEWQIIYFNLFFTTIPIVVRSIFDKDIYFLSWIKGQDSFTKRARVNISYNLQSYYPYLYYEGKDSERLSILKLILWIVEAIILGMFYFIVLVQSIEESPINIYGSMADFWYMSISMYFIVVIVVDIKLAVYTKTWTWLNFIAVFFFSMTFVIAFTWVSDLFTTIPAYNSAATVFSSSAFYFNIIYASGSSYVYYKLLIIARKEISPKLSQLFSSIVRAGKENDAKIFEDTVKAFNMKGRSGRSTATTNKQVIDQMPNIISQLGGASQTPKQPSVLLRDNDASAANLINNQSMNMPGNSSFY